MQETLEKALSKVADSPVVLSCAGRLPLPAAIARTLVFNTQGDSEKACGRHFGGRVIYICQELTAC